MRSLLTIAFPELSADDTEYWASFKDANSLASSTVVDPHFTLMFSNSIVPEAEYIAHVSRVAEECRSIRFVCRYAMLGSDDEDERAYVFLVPDEGYAAVSLLHDRLYSGPFEAYLRLDLPYVPHITVGSTYDRGRAKFLCNECNDRGVHVSGRLSRISVGWIDEGRFNVLSEHLLGSAADA